MLKNQWQVYIQQALDNPNQRKRARAMEQVGNRQTCSTGAPGASGHLYAEQTL
jgi:hypothetical protein